MAQNDTHVALIILSSQMWGGGIIGGQNFFGPSFVFLCLWRQHPFLHKTKGPTRNPISPTPPPVLRRVSMSPPPPRRAIFRLPYMPQPLSPLGARQTPCHHKVLGQGGCVGHRLYLCTQSLEDSEGWGVPADFPVPAPPPPHMLHTVCIRAWVCSITMACASYSLSSALCGMWQLVATPTPISVWISTQRVCLLSCRTATFFP